MGPPRCRGPPGQGSTGSRIKKKSAGLLPCRGVAMEAAVAMAAQVRARAGMCVCGGGVTVLAHIHTPYRGNV